MSPHDEDRGEEVNRQGFEVAEGEEREVERIKTESGV